MGLFSNLTKDGLEEAQDRTGGFSALESDLYTGKIKLAYAGKSSGGAQSVTLVTDFDGKEYRETVYITNKQGENFFLNKNDKTKKVPLPGFTIIDHICMVTTDKPLEVQEAEEKVVNIYDYDAKREVPKSVPVLIDLIGKEVSLGIIKQLENKSDKVGDEYVPNAEVRETNFIDKVFHTASKMTVVEATNGATEPVFWNSWIEKNKGQTRDKRVIKDGQAGSSGTAGRPGQNKTAPQAGEAKTERKSLFGK